MFAYKGQKPLIGEITEEIKFVSCSILTIKHVFYGNMNQCFMIYTVLVVLKCYGTGIHISHGYVNLIVLSGPQVF